MHLALLALSLTTLSSLTGAVPVEQQPAQAPIRCGLGMDPCPKGYGCQLSGPELSTGTCVRFPVLTVPVKTVPVPTPTPTPTPTSTSRPAEPTYQSCGGFRIKPLDCPKGQYCVDDPRVKGCGMACDRPGICVEPAKAQFCGGFAGFACKDKNKVCIDDPRDDCDPRNGGADCGGICV